MLEKEANGKAYLSKSALEGYAFDTLDDGLAPGVMSRRRALQLLGGTILGTLLASTIEPKSAAALQNPLVQAPRYWPIFKDIMAVTGFMTGVVLSPEQNKKVREHVANNGQALIDLPQNYLGEFLGLAADPSNVKDEEDTSGAQGVEAASEDDSDEESSSDSYSPPYNEPDPEADKKTFAQPVAEEAYAFNRLLIPN